jgi:ABC-type sugar transport system permease subunit
MRLSREEHTRLRRAARLRREATGWMFLGPMFAFFIVFLIVPVLGTIWWSTRFGSLVGGTRFVGLDNFARLPDLVGAPQAIRNTLVFAGVSVPLILAGALVIALLLARLKRGGACCPKEYENER